MQFCTFSKTAIKDGSANIKSNSNEVHNPFHLNFTYSQVGTTYTNLTIMSLYNTLHNYLSDLIPLGWFIHYQQGDVLFSITLKKKFLVHAVKHHNLISHLSH